MAKKTEAGRRGDTAGESCARSLSLPWDLDASSQALPTAPPIILVRPRPQPGRGGDHIPSVTLSCSFITSDFSAVLSAVYCLHEFFFYSQILCFCLQGFFVELQLHFFFSFYGCTCDLWTFPSQGLNQSCSCQPQPQQHQILNPLGEARD